MSDAPAAKAPVMNRERWAGVLFLLFSVGVIVFIAVVLGSAGSRDLRYTVVFDAGKDAKVGDRVQLNGVDVGQVQDVKLVRKGEAVEVRLKIAAEHKAKISAHSTAYIANSTTLNVSGQKVIEIYNSSTAAAPMPPNAVVEGKDSLLELNAWRLKEKASEWGDSLAKAGRDLRETARELGAGAREALSEMTKENPAQAPEPAESAESAEAELKAGKPEPPKAGKAAPKSSARELQLHSAEPRDPGGLPGAAPSAEPVEPAEGAPTASGGDPNASSPRSDDLGKTLAQARDLIRRLTAFLADLGARGKTDLIALGERWDRLQGEAGTLMGKLTKMGREVLGEQLKVLVVQIRRQLDSLRDRDEENVPPLDPPKEQNPQAPAPAPRGKPVPI